MLRKWMVSVGLFTIASSVPAYAQSQPQTDYNRTIGHLGVQGSNAYFDVKEGFTLNCEWGMVYMDITTDPGKAAYAELLAAKLAGKQLSRVAYTQASSGGMCTLALVEIQD